MRRRRLTAGFAALAAVAVGSSACRDPTEITFTVSTDVPCNRVVSTSISVGPLATLEGRPAAATSTSCSPADGHLGSLVVIPSGSKDAELAVRVVTGVDKSADDCVRDGEKGGCIVARRALRFTPSTALVAPIAMRASCLDIPCAPDQTCDRGTCVSATPTCAGNACNVQSTTTAPTPPATASLASLGNATGGTGTAQQQHLVYAAESGRWWFFFLDDANPSLLQTASSTDFRAWTPGASLTLVEGTVPEGRNFSVAYADVGGHDVVHVAFSHYIVASKEDAQQVRATIEGDTIAFSTEEIVTSGVPIDQMANPDGCVTSVATDGYVWAATGWRNERPLKMFDTVGNMDIFRSNSEELGASFTPGFSYVTPEWVPGWVHNRALVPSISGRMIAVWPTSDTSTDTGNLWWTALSPMPSAPVFLFSGGTGTAQEALDDWSVCAMTPASVHAVRRLLHGGANDTFEHVIYDAGSGAWSPGGLIPADAGTKDTGVVLLTSGTELLLFAVGADAANSVRYTKYVGGAWSAWATLFGSAAARTFLSGSGCDVRSHAAIVWTEAGMGANRAVGAEVTALF